MTRAEFIAEQAPRAVHNVAAAARRGGADVGNDVDTWVDGLVAEGLDRLTDTGYDPLVYGTGHAKEAVLHYALYMTGVGPEDRWVRARRAWRRKAAADYRRGAFPVSDDAVDKSADPDTSVQDIADAFDANLT